MLIMKQDDRFYVLSHLYILHGTGKIPFPVPANIVPALWQDGELGECISPITLILIALHITHAVYLTITISSTWTVNSIYSKYDWSHTVSFYLPQSREDLLCQEYSKTLPDTSSSSGEFSSHSRILI